MFDGRQTEKQGCIDFPAGTATLKTGDCHALRSIFENASCDVDTAKLMGIAFDLANAHLTVALPLIVHRVHGGPYYRSGHAGERDVIRLSAAALKGMVGAFE